MGFFKCIKFLSRANHDYMKLAAINYEMCVYPAWCKAQVKCKNPSLNSDREAWDSNTEPPCLCAANSQQWEKVILECKSACQNLTESCKSLSHWGCRGYGRAASFTWLRGYFYIRTEKNLWMRRKENHRLHYSNSVTECGSTALSSILRQPEGLKWVRAAKWWHVGKCFILTSTAKGRCWGPVSRTPLTCATRNGYFKSAYM